MDEYLFIVLAKLKADRLRLAREQSRVAAGQQDLFDEPQVATPHRSPHRSTHHSTETRWFSSEPERPVRT